MNKILLPAFILLNVLPALASAQSGKISKKQQDSLDKVYEKKMMALSHSQDSLVRGKKAPVMEFTTATGKKYPADFGNKIVVLNFYTTWCGPCRMEMPELDELKSEFAGDSVTFVSFCTDCDSVLLKRSLQRTPFSYEPVILPSSKKVMEQFYVTGYPTNVIISKNAEITLFETGFSNLIVKQMRKELRNELGKK